MRLSASTCRETEYSALAEGAGGVVQWCGRGHPALTHKIFNALLQAERRTPGASEKAGLLRHRTIGATCVDAYFIMISGGVTPLP